MTLNDIEIAPMFQNEMPLAFERDEVDAAQTYPPNSSVILASGKAHKLFDSSMAPGLIVDILAGNPEMLSKRTDDFSALIRAFFRAQEYARQHPQEAMRIMAERQGLSVVAFEEALEGLQLIPLEEQASFLAESGKLQEGLDVAKKSLADVGLLKNMAGLDQLFADAGPAKNAVGQ